MCEASGEAFSAMYAAAGTIFLAGGSVWYVLS